MHSHLLSQFSLGILMIGQKQYRSKSEFIMFITLYGLPWGAQEKTQDTHQEPDHDDETSETEPSQAEPRRAEFPLKNTKE